LAKGKHMDKSTGGIGYEGFENVFEKLIEEYLPREVVSY